MANELKKSAEKEVREMSATRRLFTNDMVVLGMVLAVEINQEIEHQEEDGAFIPVFKLKKVEAYDPEKIAETRKDFIADRKELLMSIGDTSPVDSLLVDELISARLGSEELTEERAKEIFWEIYLELEKQYEVGFIPTIEYQPNGMFPSFKFVQKKAPVEDKLNQPISEEPEEKKEDEEEVIPTPEPEEVVDTPASEEV